MTKKIKERLLATIEEIPESKLDEVLDFTEFLIAKERNKQESRLDLEPEKDPIIDYIGGVTHGSLAEGIDNELYGEKV